MTSSMQTFRSITMWACITQWLTTNTYLIIKRICKICSGQLKMHKTCFTSCHNSPIYDKTNSISNKHFHETGQDDLTIPTTYMRDSSRFPLTGKREMKYPIFSDYHYRRVVLLYKNVTEKYKRSLNQFFNSRANNYWLTHLLLTNCVRTLSNTKCKQMVWWKGQNVLFQLHMQYTLSSLKYRKIRSCLGPLTLK